ncbi:hypothetical protein GWI33_012667 [Rhynchophorus ferrugineus]|uniref:Uncharacterized protein n=1 Tax=Rhynchophorus ferrugineus TaxID=354439 RepID=A0A834I624_RHYFE|nr:hypothetical protein GWI33_012667 [Rhynchophorus ferrugineus]
MRIRTPYASIGKYSDGLRQMSNTKMFRIKFSPPAPPSPLCRRRVVIHAAPPRRNLVEISSTYFGNCLRPLLFPMQIKTFALQFGQNAQ